MERVAGHVGEPPKFTPDILFLQLPAKPVPLLNNKTGEETKLVDAVEDSVSRFRGRAKFRRECFNDNNERIYRTTVKGGKPNILTNPADPTQMSRGWMFTFPFSLDVDFNYYCADYLWVKKANMMAIGEQTYVEGYSGGDYGCEVPVQLYELPSSD